MVGQRQPATGFARWLSEIDPCSGNRYLRIAVARVSRDYEVEQVVGGFNLHHLSDRKPFGVVTYHVRVCGVNDWRCSCEDAKRRTCKHTLALRAALARLPL